MVDRISIRMSDVYLNFTHMGTPFVVTSSGYKKFKIYYKNTPEPQDSFLVIKAKQGERGVYVDGNLRKWATLGNITSDLTYEKLKQVYERIALRLDLPVEAVLNGIITQIEVGMNVKLPPDYIRILDTIGSLPRHKLKDVAGETKEFFCNSHSVIFYDKIKEYCKTKKVSQKSRKTLSKHVAVIRVELKIKQVAAYVHTGMFRTGNDLFNNFERIQRHLIDIIEQIKYLDIISPTTFTRFEGGNQTELSKELLGFAIDEIGFSKFTNIIKRNIRKNKISETIKHFQCIHNKYRSIEKVHYVPNFKAACKKRLLKLAN